MPEASDEGGRNLSSGVTSKKIYKKVKLLAVRVVAAAATGLRLSASYYLPHVRSWGPADRLA